MDGLAFLGWAYLTRILSFLYLLRMEINYPLVWQVDRKFPLFLKLDSNILRRKFSHFTNHPIGTYNWFVQYRQMAPIRLRRQGNLEKSQRKGKKSSIRLQPRAQAKSLQLGLQNYVIPARVMIQGFA